MDVKIEKKIKHYSSHHKILLVGEGDFSFSLCLAKAFGSASNMVATSLDSKGMYFWGTESLVRNYSRASTNLNELENLGCTIVHEVDAHSMGEHPLLQMKSFDRIVFNFPHAGFQYFEDSSCQIDRHRGLLRGFMNSAKKMLSKFGEIHVTHKTAYPFSKWEIVKLAKKVELFLDEEVPFILWDYPGYINLRGSGYNCDGTFPIGASSTFKFKKD